MSPKVLILTAFKNIERFQRRVDNRTLLWGLDQANIEWELCRPWKDLPDLNQFQAVFSSLYRPIYRNFSFYAQVVEEKCAALGIPVIQSAKNILPSHTYFLNRWSQDNISCANFKSFEHFEEINLQYPMILRKDGMHRGQNMFFVHSAEEARKVIHDQRILAEANFPNMNGPQELDLAIEFVDTRNDMGIYEKWRCYVVGDEIIPAHYLRSKTRFVNYKDSILDAETCAVDRDYLAGNIPNRSMILEAAKSTGFNIIALDYSKTRDGQYIFWEGNRQRGTAGDPRIKWLGIRPSDMLYGKAVASLILNRIKEPVKI